MDAYPPDIDPLGRKLPIRKYVALILIRIASGHTDCIITPPQVGIFVFLKGQEPLLKWAADCALYLSSFDSAHLSTTDTLRIMHN